MSWEAWGEPDDAPQCGCQHDADEHEADDTKEFGAGKCGGGTPESPCDCEEYHPDESLFDD